VNTGYRLFDCAEIYGNEEDVGAALRDAAVSREELSVISKFWFTHNSPADLRDSLGRSLEAMGLDYFDLYMLHWPSETMDFDAIVGAMSAEKGAGRIRQIGVCNLPYSLLRRYIDARYEIDAVELEWHVYLDQSRTYELLRSHGIPFIAYCPLAQGRVANDPVLVEIGRAHDVSASTIALAALIENDGVTAIPKAASRRHQLANLEASKIRLSPAERDRIASLSKDVRLANFPFSPAWDG
jgi:2,5-diketo-D-gluconate reductase B